MRSMRIRRRAIGNAHPSRRVKFYFSLISLCPRTKHSNSHFEGLGSWRTEVGELCLIQAYQSDLSPSTCLHAHQPGGPSNRVGCVASVTSFTLPLCPPSVVFAAVGDTICPCKLSSSFRSSALSPLHSSCASVTRCRRCETAVLRSSSCSKHSSFPAVDLERLSICFAKASQNGGD